MIGSVNGGPITGIGPTRPDKTGGAEVQFSPDGASIVAFYNADKTSWLLDPAGGPGTKLTYDAVSPSTWQPPGALTPALTLLLAADLPDWARRPPPHPDPECEAGAATAHAILSERGHMSRATA